MCPCIPGRPSNSHKNVASILLLTYVPKRSQYACLIYNTHVFNEHVFTGSQSPAKDAQGLLRGSVGMHFDQVDLEERSINMDCRMFSDGLLIAFDNNRLIIEP